MSGSGRPDRPWLDLSWWWEATRTALGASLWLAIVIPFVAGLWVYEVGRKVWLGSKSGPGPCSHSGDGDCPECEAERLERGGI
jgi:hypothetical protein